MQPQRVTQHSEANEQLLYFTSSSLWADDTHLVFLSDRTGQPNIFLRDLQTGGERQLSQNEEGWLKSYVYFDGLPYQGLGKASVSLDPRNGNVYYLQGRQICQADPQGSMRVLNELPAGQMTAFTHVSGDGRRLCIPTTDARALDGDAQLSGRPAYDIDQRVQDENLNSYLWVVDTQTGSILAHECVPRAWITHVQFSPINSSLILYNHEWPGDCGIRRMWLFDGKQHIRLRQEGEGRSRADWTCHEMWQRDGQAVIYHGQYGHGTSYLGRVNPDGSDAREVTLPVDWTAYGHFTVGDSGALVTDGYYQAPEDEGADNGQWISRVAVDWTNLSSHWTAICRHRSSWNSQDSHPHPIYNHKADHIYFTSDWEGKRAVYAAA